VHALAALEPRYPKVSADTRRELQAVRQELEAEAPKGEPADPYEAAQAHS
jgi:hypothetical protein